MEQAPIYQSINFYFCGGYNYGSVVNASAWTTVLGVFLCPSDSNAGATKPSITNYTGAPNTNSYRGSVGTTTAQYWTSAGPAGPGYASCSPDPYNLQGGQPGCAPQSTGMFCYWIPYGIRDCLDGTSNTVCFSESLVGNATSSTNQTRTNAITGVSGAQVADAMDVSMLPNATLQTALLACTNAYYNNPSNTNITNVVGNRWGWGATTETLFHTIVTPNSQLQKWNSCRSSCGGCGPDDSSYSNAQSNHPGGVNCLMSDGSVKFIKDSVNVKTLRGLVTLMGGEVLDASSY
jgi:prepilin-type processing-associated H-X9-DG protein